MLAVKTESCPYLACGAERVGPAVCPACNNVVVKCARCNGFNRVFARYCRFCGASLAGDSWHDYYYANCGPGAGISSIALSGASQICSPKFTNVQIFAGPEAEEVAGAIGAYGYVFVWTGTGRIHFFKQFRDELALSPIGSVGERIIPPLFVSREHLFCFTAAKVVAFDLSKLFYVDEPAAACGEGTTGSGDAADVKDCEVYQCGRKFYVLRREGGGTDVSVVTYEVTDEGRLDFKSESFGVKEPLLRLALGDKDVFALGKSLVYKLDGNISAKFKVRSKGYEFDVSAPAYCFDDKVYAFYISSVGGSYEKAVCQIDLESRKPPRFELAVPLAANLSVTEKWVCVNAANGECFLWDRETASLVSRKRIVENLGVEFPPLIFKDVIILVDSNTGGVHIIDVPNDKVYATATGERGGIKKLPAYSCGEVIVTTQTNKVCRLPVR
jgi:hypothetical protein